ncbi:MAG TPA: hypothetical protein VGC04_00345 [Cellulomonas sp.]
MAVNDWLGPVDHLILHVEPGASPAGGLSRLRTLVESGTIALLDLEVVVGAATGPRSLDAGTWGDGAGLDLHAFDGVWSGLLDHDDLVAARDGVGDEVVALVVVYEVTAFRPVLAAWDRPGVTLAGSGPVSEDDLVAALAADGSTI